MELLKATWIVPVSSDPIKHGAIVIMGTKIVAVGPSKELMAKYPDVTVRDFGSSVIMPGFVDLHTHLEYSVMRGVCDDLPFGGWKVQIADKSQSLKDEDWRVSAKLGALEALASGITTIADITPTGASLDAALESGLRARVYLEITGMDPRETASKVSASLKTFEGWQKRAAGSIVQLGLGPHAPYTVTPTLYAAICAKARELDLPVATHLAGSQEEFDFVKYGSSVLAGSYRDSEGWQELLWQPTGVSPVKYLEQWDVFESDVLAIHCVHVTREDLSLLKKYDVAVGHCPRCNAKLGMGIAPLDEFNARGLRVGLGTDSPASNNTMDFFDEMRIGLLLQRGRTGATEGAGSSDFVRMATLGGAEALGLGSHVGSLQAGLEADIIVVDIATSHQVPAVEPYSGLVYTANQEDVVMTMVAGKVLYENGEFKTLDEHRIGSDALPIRERIFA